MLTRKLQTACKLTIQQSPSGAGDIAEIIYFTHDGVLSVAGEEIGTAGFSIAHQITVTKEVLEVVAISINR